MRGFHEQLHFNPTPNNLNVNMPPLTQQSSTYSRSTFGNPHSPSDLQQSAHFKNSPASPMNNNLHHQDIFHRPEPNPMMNLYLQPGHSQHNSQYNSSGMLQHNNYDQPMSQSQAIQPQQLSNSSFHNTQKSQYHAPTAHKESQQKLQQQNNEYPISENHNYNSARDADPNDSFSGQHSTSTTSSKPSKKPLIIITIEIGGGNKDKLIIFEGEDPLAVIQSFCQRNNLHPKVVEPLFDNIKVELASHKRNKEERAKQRRLSRSRHEESISNNNTSSMQSSNTASRNSFKRDSSQNDRSYDNQRREDNYNITPSKQNYGSSKRDTSDVMEKDRSKSPMRATNAKGMNNHSQSTKSLRSATKTFNEAPSTRDTEYEEEIESEAQKEFNNATQEIFNRLHQDAIAKQNRQNRNKEIFQAEREQKEMAETTFRPKINESSIILAEKHREFVNSKWAQKSAKDLHTQSTKSLKGHLELSRDAFDSHYDISTMSNGTRSVKHAYQPHDDFPVYTPSQATPKSTRNITPTKGAHLRLYQDAKKKEVKQAEIQQAAKKEYSFKPQINKRPARQQNNVSEIHTEPNVRERSLSSKKKDPERDPKTGQKLFHPKINRESTYYQNAKNKEERTFVEEVIELDEYEYNEITQRNQMPTEKKTLKESIMRQTRGANGQPNSKLLSKEEKILKIIFNSLDADQDGEISAENVDYSRLNPEVLDTISDILFAIGEQGASYNYEKFKKLVIKLGLLSKLSNILNIDLDLEPRSTEDTQTQFDPSQDLDDNNTLINGSFMTHDRDTTRKDKGVRFGELDDERVVRPTTSDNKGKTLTKRYQHIANKSFKTQS